MTQMKRRDFLNAAAVTAGGTVFAAVAPKFAEASQAMTPPSPRAGYPSRPAGKVEILFKAPGLSGNGTSRGSPFFFPGRPVCERDPRS